jgi:hypothetical protein
LRYRLTLIASHVFPWALFWAFLLWGWRVRNLFRDVPYYGDVLEVLWGTKWYADNWLHGGDTTFYPSIFHPIGWQVGTFAHSPALFLFLAPLSWLGGVAFAYNIALIISFGIAFAGMYRLARGTHFSFILAALVSVLFTFLGFHWLRIGGHLNQLLGSALMPWALWCMKRAWADKRPAFRWFVAAGVLWGFAAAISFYFVWLGAISVFGWMFGKWITCRNDWRTLVRGLLVMTVIAAILSGPFLWQYMQAIKMAGVPSNDIAWTSDWGASLNSLPTPSAGHPIALLKSLHRWLYRGPQDESAVANLGILAFVLALVGIWQARKARNWWPVFVVTASGLVFALGYTLRWNGKSIGWSGFRLIDQAIWSLGHYLKPDFFRPAEPYGPFVQGLPLPGLLFAAIMPFWEGARTLSRFAFVALPGFFLLVGRGLQASRRLPLQAAFAILLLVEVLPAPSQSFPAFPAAHPAFDWLRMNTEQQDGVIDLRAPQPDMLEPLFDGKILWADQYRQRATAAGAGSVWPAHTWFLREWLLHHPKGFQDTDFAPLLRFYSVRYIVLHMGGGNERAALQKAQQNRELQLERCFDPPPGPSPWGYPICVIRVLPFAHPGFNLVFGDGWSGHEEWGLWAEGAASDARWGATAKSDYSLQIEAFPMCVPGMSQSLSLLVNNVPLSTYMWYDCDQWSADMEIPAAMVNVGWNVLTFRYAYAVKPVTVTKGQNLDERDLSVGFTKLQIGRR